MTEHYPTVYVGGDPGPNDPDRVAVDKALHETVGIYNALPDHLMGRYVASVVLSLCMSASDPAGALEDLYQLVGREIALLTARSEGTA